MPIQTTPGRITPPVTPPTAGTPGRGTGGVPGVAQAGITGVRSSSQDTSIRVYNNQQVYSQWAFDASAMFNRMGCIAAMRGQPGGPGRGGPGGLPGGRPGGPGGGLNVPGGFPPGGARPGGPPAGGRPGGPGTPPPTTGRPGGGGPIIR
jgi:hypothetical protein